MNARRRLSSVPAAKPVHRFAESPGWAYRTEHNCCAYADAIAKLREGPQSKWVMDPDAPRPRWMANPIPKETT